MSINPQQFMKFHEEYRGRLLNSMTVLSRSRDAAEDLTAKAFAIAFEKIGSFRGESSLYTWVHAIAIHAFYSSKRGHDTLESADSLDVEALREPDLLLQTLERSECCANIRAALRKIPALHRRALTDHFVRGYSVKRIARQDRIPVGTVLSRIFKAKRLLRAAWEA